MANKRIVLISCVSRKRRTKAKAKELYISPLFKKSLAFAYLIKPERILILSAKHHVLELDEEIEPYDATLSYVSPKERAKKPGLKVLSKTEAMKWGDVVLGQLEQLADLERDRFIILAGKSYINPLRHGLTNIEEPLRGLGQGPRLKFLTSILNE